MAVDFPAHADALRRTLEVVRGRSAGWYERRNLELRRAVEEVPSNKEAMLERAALARSAGDEGTFISNRLLAVEADPGQTQTLTFVADKPGSFRFRCNVTCGAMHPFMIGKLTVGTNEWLFRSIGLAGVAVLGTVVLVKRKA